MTNKASQIRAWINQNAPFLASLLENKYTGMLWDRFRSLPRRKQKEIINVLIISFIVFLIVFLFVNLYDVYAYRGQIAESNKIIDALEEFQKFYNEKGGELQSISHQQNFRDISDIKKYIVDTLRMVSISSSSLSIEETSHNASQIKKASDVEKNRDQDVSKKEVFIKVSHINLKQLKNFLQAFEYGPYEISILSIRINNETSKRGFMNLEFTIETFVKNNT